MQTPGSSESPAEKPVLQISDAPTCCAREAGETPPHLFAERHSDLVPALGRVLDHQVVQRSEASGDLVAALLGRGGCTAVVRLGR